MLVGNYTDLSTDTEHDDLNEELQSMWIIPTTLILLKINHLIEQNVIVTVLKPHRFQ